MSDVKPGGEININGIISKIEPKAKSLMASLASEAYELIIDEYRYVVDQFYQDYTPKYYVRHSVRKGTEAYWLKVKNYKNVKRFDGKGGHASDGLDPWRTSYAFTLKDSGHALYGGGIEINNVNMYSDYGTDPNNVLWSFLHGYHGPENKGIRYLINGMSPIEYMRDYQQQLIEHYEKICTPKDSTD